MLKLSRILVPLDWSESSRCAFELASSLASTSGAELILLYVVPLPTLMYGPAPENYLAHLRDELSLLKPEDERVRVRHLVAEGCPAKVIMDTAKECQCDLIVIGTHGRQGLNRFLLGSVAEDVVRKAPCLVMTVRSPLATAAVRKVS